MEKAPNEVRENSVLASPRFALSSPNPPLSVYINVVPSSTGQLQYQCERQRYVPGSQGFAILF